MTWFLDKLFNSWLGPVCVLLYFGTALVLMKCGGRAP